MRLPCVLDALFICTFECGLHVCLFCASHVLLPCRQLLHAANFYHRRFLWCQLAVGGRAAASHPPGIVLPGLSAPGAVLLGSAWAIFACAPPVSAPHADFDVLCAGRGLGMVSHGARLPDWRRPLWAVMGGQAGKAVIQNQGQEMG